MHESWLLGLAGGVGIGLAAVLMWGFYGRIMGVSGIVAGLWQQRGGERVWRWYFIAGLLAAGLLANLFSKDFNMPIATPWGWLIVAGFLVGFGTRMGSGCTSGHGVCGMARLSKRSFAAVIAFVLAGMASVAILRHLLGVL